MKYRLFIFFGIMYYVYPLKAVAKEDIVDHWAHSGIDVFSRNINFVIVIYIAAATLLIQSGSHRFENIENLTKNFTNKKWNKIEFTLSCITFFPTPKSRKVWMAKRRFSCQIGPSICKTPTSLSPESFNIISAWMLQSIIFGEMVAMDVLGSQLSFSFSSNSKHRYRKISKNFFPINIEIDSR